MAGGKSAILTGLIVALGGNAQATNRGSSLKGFVKEGERYMLQLIRQDLLKMNILRFKLNFFPLLSAADVSITLNNIGRDAYKPGVYGQTIIVDQRITREGIRSYKLKNHSGNVNYLFIYFASYHPVLNLIFTCCW